MKPNIRVGLTIDGDIEAMSQEMPVRYRLTIDRRTGNVLTSTVPAYTDMFRWLVRAAREEIAR